MPENNPLDDDLLLEDGGVLLMESPTGNLLLESSGDNPDFDSLKYQDRLRIRLQDKV